ncbi:MAG: hypothetical protein R2794_12470 [Chitinophagales bacterium]
MANKFLLLLFTIGLYVPVQGQTRHARTGDMQFIENAGRSEFPYAFSADVYGGAVFLEKNGFKWTFSNLSDVAEIKHTGDVSALNDFIVKRHNFSSILLAPPILCKYPRRCLHQLL